MESLWRSLVTELFAEKLLTDERNPVVVFSVPRIEGTWGLFLPLLEHWRQLILVSSYCLVSCLRYSATFLLTFAFFASCLPLVIHTHNSSPSYVS